jgi:hypothetical protein
MRPVLLAATLLIATTLGACADPITTGPLEPATAEAAGSHLRPAALAPQGAGGPASQNRIYAAVRAATARYHDIDRALADGYSLASECVVTPSGGMGYHYVRGDLMDGVLEPTRPEALLYEPQQNGRLRLVAVEWIIVAALWDGEGIPMLGSQPFDDHTAPGSGGPPFPHYQLHAWLWKHNPAGMHTQFNPNVNCDHAFAH